MTENIQVGDILGYREENVIRYAFVLEVKEKNKVWKFMGVKDGEEYLFWRKFDYMNVIRVIKNNVDI